MKSIMLFFILMNILFLSGCLKESSHSDLPSLDDSHPPIAPINPVVERATSFKVKIGDRYFVESVLLSVFKNNDGSAASSDGAVESLITNKILKNPNIFRGYCFDYDDSSCRATTGSGNSHTRADEVDGEAQASFNAVRQAYIVGLCEELVEIDQALVVALNNGQLTDQSSFAKVNIEKMYKRFYPARDLSDVLYSSMKSLSDKSLAQYSGNKQTAWRTIVYALCASPGWQVL